jgi:hypothetical protein
MNECLGEHLRGEADVLECLVLAPAGHDVGEGTERILEQGRLHAKPEIKIKTKPSTRIIHDLGYVLPSIQRFFESECESGSMFLF